MFFDDLSQIPQIALKTGTSIFVVPDESKIDIPGAIVLEPEEKTTITIDQVRKVMAGLNLKQYNDRLVMIRPAELLGLEAANALLKNLEEPGEKVHYILITNALPQILPTILSRAAVYFWKDERGSDVEIRADEKRKQLAKKIIAANSHDLVEIAEAIAKKKANARKEALEILGLTIEMLYKSYYLTNKEVFVKRLPAVLLAYDNINKNGHVKLHLVADLC